MKIRLLLPTLLAVLIPLAASAQVSLQLNDYLGTGLRPFAVTGASSSGATITADTLGNSTRNDMGLIGPINSGTPAVFTEVGNTIVYRFHLGDLTINGNAFGPGYRVGFDFGSTAALRYTTSFGVGGSLDFSSNDNGNPFASGTTHILYDTEWSPYTTEIDMKSLRFDEPNELDATVSLELVAINDGLYDYKMTVTYVSTVDAKTNTKSYTFTGVDGNEVGSVYHVTNDIRWTDGSQYTLSDASLEFYEVSPLDPEPPSLALDDYIPYGKSDFTLTGVSNSGGTITYTTDTVPDRFDVGTVAAIQSTTQTPFTEIGDTITYRFHLGGINVPTSTAVPPDYPDWFVGFDFGSTHCLRYVTSFGPEDLLKFASNTNGNPFSTQNQGGTKPSPATVADWSPSTLSGIRFDNGNEIDVTVSLKLISINDSSYNYEMTVSYQSSLTSDSNSASAIFTDINGDTVVALFHVTNSAWVEKSDTVGTTYTISDASIEFTEGSGANPDDVYLETKALVNALSEGTPEEQVKKAVLQLAMERATEAHKVSLIDEADAIVSDVEQALSQAASDFTKRNPDAPVNLPILRPLITPYADNPYLQKFVEDTNQDLATPDVSWPRALTYNGTIDGLGGVTGSRTAYKLMSNYVWLFGHEESPMKFDPELLKRILRRAHAYLDSLELAPNVNVDPIPNWYDQFSVHAAFTALYEIRSLYPGLLLPGQLERWDTIMDEVGINMQGWGFLQRGSSPWNINIETGRVVGALVAGFWTGNSWLVKRAMDHVDATTSRVYPDGAVPYHGVGQASTNYHNELLEEWLILYELTGHEPILEGMVNTEWKGPVMGRTEEFWTSPFYKTYRWNYNKGTEAGSELVATMTQNPYVRWLLDRDMFSEGYYGPGADVIYRYLAPWYDNGVSPKPLPDNYTIADRNAGGPRGWYGNWNYAGAFRPNPNSTDYEGHETLMGAMTVDDDGQVNSILVDVTPRIWQTPEPTDTLSAWATLTIDEVPATTISRNYSVSTSIHGTTRVRGGAYRTDDDSRWTSRQVWVGLPDRIVGLVSTVPTADEAAAYTVNGVVRLISGGSTGAKTLKVLEEITPNEHYRYGELDVIVHDTTYTSLTGLEVEYRVPQFPATELTFSNRASEPLPAGSQTTFPASTEFGFVVEVRPTWTTTDLTSVSVLGDHDLLGLELVSDERSLQVWLNAADSPQNVTLHRETLPMGEDSFVLSDGVLGRASFNPNVPNSVTLEPGQHAVLVVSGDSNDRRVGWQSFAHLVGSAWANYETSQNGWFDTADWLGAIYPMQDWVYSDSLSNYLYLRQEWVNPDSGCFAFVHRDPSIPSLVDGVPLEDNVLPESGLVDTQSWLGWLYVAEQGWAYAYSLKSWIWIDEPGVNQAGAWIYLN